MNVAICDDQKECNEKLCRMLKSYFTQRDINSNITEYTSGTELSKAYAPGLFDFVFLDVQMPGLNGLETAGRIRKEDLSVDIIFVTNMHDQVCMGFNYNAKGFLIKEVSQEQIDTLMDRLIAEMRRRKDIGVYTIKLKFDEGTILLRLSDVLYFESRDKDIIAATKDAEFEFRNQLSVVEEDIKGKGFIRINRSLLVNTLHVFKDFKDYLVLKGTSEKLPIGRSYKTSVRKALNTKGAKS
ncbi:MAG: LytTR family DNA-binding domain-containing protein [Defluviitaleaceae bacterium]|nr:LytTR family DNA-binding domain-containing protein [Defluviitaleaceae bacterium]